MSASVIATSVLLESTDLRRGCAGSSDMVTPTVVSAPQLRVWLHRTTACLLLSASLGGCGSARGRHPPPEAIAESVQVVGMPGNVRDWGDRSSAILQRSFLEAAAQADGAFGMDVPTDGLAISGGGSYGAFAAGVLCGWTDSGTRPVFRTVTGVSVGAIIAPFAFLGFGYDERLEDMAKSATTDNLYRVRWWTEALTGDSVADTAPLRRFVQRYFDDEVLHAIAVEHHKGRRLLIATTNLDANRPVIWDLGAVAASGSPRALDLFRDVIMASAAVPVLFPPVYIDVECDGIVYDEMHVDGGVTSQVLLYGSAVSRHDVVRESLPNAPSATYYVIRNGKFSTEWAPVRPRVLDIASRSISRIIQAQGVGDLWQVYAACRRDGLEFRLAFIPDEVAVPTDPEFDTVVVADLFERGRTLAREGYPWRTEPPGLRSNGPYDEARPGPSGSGRGPTNPLCRAVYQHAGRP